jgi:hypothetical protein
VDFVLSHPRRERGWLFPDWNSVAHQCDGVHMTLRAIAATQGLYFPTEQGIVAAPYWDIESTLWLRWCFGSVRLVETVTGPVDNGAVSASHDWHPVLRYSWPDNDEHHRSTNNGSDDEKKHR